MLDTGDRRYDAQRCHLLAPRAMSSHRRRTAVITKGLHQVGGQRMTLSFGLFRFNGSRHSGEVDGDTSMGLDVPLPAESDDKGLRYRCADAINNREEQPTPRPLIRSA